MFNELEICTQCGLLISFMWGHFKTSTYLLLKNRSVFASIHVKRVEGLDPFNTVYLCHTSVPLPRLDVYLPL